MPRAPRIHIDGGRYHVILRGNHRKPIFHQPSDRDDFETILSEALERYSSRVLAYCWMTNHIHAVIRVANQPIGRLVQLVASRYARRLQRRIPTTGHLFERRYRSRVIADEQYLRQAVLYIHFNPVEAGIVKDPAEYAWSSHRHYMGAPAPRWLDIDDVLNCLGTSRKAASAAYRTLIATPPETCDVSEWVAGITRKRGVPAPAHRSPEHDPAPTLETVVTDIANRYGVSAAAMASKSRAPVLSAARAALAYEAVSSGTATLTEVARRLNRAPSTVSWLLAQARESMETHPGQQG